MYFTCQHTHKQCSVIKDSQIYITIHGISLLRSCWHVWLPRAVIYHVRVSWQGCLQCCAKSLIWNQTKLHQIVAQATDTTKFDLVSQTDKQNINHLRESNIFNWIYLKSFCNALMRIHWNAQICPPLPVPTSSALVSLWASLTCLQSMELPPSPSSALLWKLPG